MNDGEADAGQAMTEFRSLLAGRWIGPAVHAAAKLGLADALADGPRSAESLADTADADAGALERLLRALTTIGVFRQSGDGYELTPLGALLRTDSEFGLRNEILLTGGERSWRSWSQFVECVRTGKPAVTILDGVEDPFAWFAERPEEQAKFDAAMAEGTHRAAGAIATAYDFSGIGTVVDVGGGHGALLVPILHANPSMTGVVFDRPHCAAGAGKRIEREGLGERYRFSGGDFFTDPLPPGADAYLLKSVIHDWNDERAIGILRACRQAMTAASRLLLLEVVIPDRLAQLPDHRRMMWADLNMLVATGGRERTESHYRALLDAAGLRMSRILPTSTPTRMNVVEALPA